jgi:thiol-disulfide isomerase/thioredoxin
MRRFLLLAALAVVPALASAQELGIAVGAKAPGGALETLDGKPTNLSDYMGKKPVVFEFWATWCGNCKQLEPSMLAALKKYSGKVEFVGVAVSVNQSSELVKKYAEKHQLPGTILYDRKGYASDAFDVPATSYVVVVGKDGLVKYTGLGGDQNVEAAIKKAM